MLHCTLIICTYKRPQALLRLLQSVAKQSRYPDCILIVDGSEDATTATLLAKHHFEHLEYHRVDASDRGLTKQRNYGLAHMPNTTDVVCFLDDDTVLEPEYFEELLITYRKYPDALGVGGYITNEVEWKPTDNPFTGSTYFYKDGWMRKEPFRFRVRRWFGLAPDRPPCHLPTFSHGRSVSFLPPSGKTYAVEHFMGGVASYRASVFDDLSFSTYFEGYGLYEDAEFCFRLRRQGPLYVNTAARLAHYHEVLGRPNTFKYGRMVIRNGWYVWRVRYPHPSLKARVKWHATALLLAHLSLFRGVLGGHKPTFMDGLGRVMGWWQLLFDKPKLQG